MTHVFALAALRGRPGAGPLVDRGLAALTGPFRDAEHGGWFSSLTSDGAPAATGKSAYDHAFVVLAAASATAAGRSWSATGGRTATCTRWRPSSPPPRWPVTTGGSAGLRASSSGSCTPPP